MKSYTVRSFVLATLTFGLVAPGMAQKQPLTPEWIHQKLGVIVYPAKGQKPDQQKKDEIECYGWAQSQTGIDPTAPPTVAAPVAPAPNQAQGARARGAAKGAVGGAVVGGIAGDAGKGAAAGAAAGVVVGGHQKRQGRRAAAEQTQQAQAASQQQASATDAQKLDTFKKGYSVCVEGRGYSVK